MFGRDNYVRMLELGTFKVHNYSVMLVVVECTINRHKFDRLRLAANAHVQWAFTYPPPPTHTFLMCGMLLSLTPFPHR